MLLLGSCEICTKRFITYEDYYTKKGGAVRKET